MADEPVFDMGVTVRGFASGEKVFDRYTLQRMLGRGGMGVVWLARDEELRRDIALKFLPEMVAADPTSIDDLKRETSRSLDLTHPHIVRVHDFVTNGTLAAISMEFVSGRTLAELRLQQATRLFETAELNGWVTELCAALTYAHEDASLVHRDLKPSNLMVDARRRLKVTDFGIAATVSDTVTRVSRLASSGGTPAYASPQQIMGEPPSAADDIYSVGATLFELLTSKPPFYRGNLNLQVQTKRPPTLAARRSELGLQGAPVPPEWEEVVAACLEKDPQLRPASIREIGGRLGLALTPPAPRVRIDDDLGSSVTVPSFGARVTPAADAVTMPRSPRAPTIPPTAPPTVGPTEATSAPPPPAPVGPIASTPPSVAVPTKPRSRAGRWVAAFVVLGMFGAGVWIADVPNRFAASSAERKGQQALVTADLPVALDHFRQAVLRRPADAALRTAFDETQAQWLEDVQQQTRNLAPREALAALTDDVRATGSQLTGAHANAFREFVDTVANAAHADLVQALAKIEGLAREGHFESATAELARLESEAGALPQFSQTGKRLQEIETRRKIDDASKQAGEGNYAAALSALDDVAGGGLLVGEVEAARTAVRRAAASGNVERLSRAIRAERPDEIRTILETNGRVTGEAAAVAARELLAARTVASLRTAVEGAGYVAPPDSSVNLPLHVLMETLRDRFTDPAGVSRYLATSYESWADELAADDQTGFALYALERAEREGGTVSPALQNDISAAAAELIDLTLQIPPTEQPARDNPVPVDSARAALRDMIGRTVGSWIEVVELRPVGERFPPLELRTSVSDIDTRDVPTTKGEQFRYQSGTERIRNPEYARTSEELRTAQAEMADLQRQLQQLRRGGNSDGERIVGGLLAIGVQTRADTAEKRVRDLQSKLAQTPQSIDNPTYAYENYQIISHDVTYSTALTARMYRGNEELAPWAVWNAALAHQTRAVVGNAARGVPVESARYPNLRDVATRLGAGLGEEVRRNTDAVLHQLAIASFSALESQLTADGASAAVTADRRWALGRLWRLSGMSVSQTPELERAVRAQLGLPVIRENLIPTAPPAKTQHGVPVKGLAPTLETVAPPVESKSVPGKTTSAVKASSSSTPTKGAPSPPAVERLPTQVYYSQTGDTLGRIAARLRMPVEKLKAANPDVASGRLKVGTRIVVPRE